MLRPYIISSGRGSVALLEFLATAAGTRIVASDTRIEIGDEGRLGDAARSAPLC